MFAMGCDSAKGSPPADDDSEARRDDGANEDRPKKKKKPKPDPAVAKHIAVLEDPNATPREKVDAADAIGEIGAKALPQLEASWKAHDTKKEGSLLVRIALLHAAGALGEDGLPIVHRALSSPVSVLRTAACQQAAENAEAVVKDEERREKIVGLMSLYKSESECMDALVAVAKARKARDRE